MIVVHFESGLGNQMLNYAEYLAVKKTHPKEDIYYETIIYELNDAQDKINMWNGFELKRIFSINMVNISELFLDEEWQLIISEVRNSRFWEYNWNYSEVICKVLSMHGIQLCNLTSFISVKRSMQKYIDSFTKTRIGYMLKRIISHLISNKISHRKANPDILFLENKHDFYTGQKLLFMYKGNKIEEIEKDLISDFQFPPINKNTKNSDILELIKNCNAVALHIRRSDMLYANEYLYKFGYFRRAVCKIRKKINNPKFFIFGDTDSANWVFDNYTKIGLREKDNIMYINWNKGEESFRDMQLMTYCKGIIFTNSSFGWWGAYLNQVKGKITISPFANYNTTDWV
nr:alpha-1,2-fucosyltransferase [uncultured Eisenbergiella sp.]